MMVKYISMISSYSRVQERKRLTVIGRVIARHISTNESMARVVKTRCWLEGEAIKSVPEFIVGRLAHYHSDVSRSEIAADGLQEVANDAVVGEALVRADMNDGSLERSARYTSRVGAFERLSCKRNHGVIWGEVWECIGAWSPSTTEATEGIE